MDIELTDEQRMLQTTTRRFLEAEEPMASIRSRSGHGRSFSEEYWRRAAELGWTSMLIPDSAGGTSDPSAVLDLAIIAEEAGRAMQGGPLLTSNVVIDAIVREGSDEQRNQYLPSLADGSLIATWAFGEGMDGWNVRDVAVKAEKDGAEYIVDGTKTSVEAADVADVFLVTAQSSDGLVQLLVPSDRDGIEVTLLPTLDLTTNYGNVTFKSVRVPSTARLGSDPTSQASVERQLLLALTLQCAEMVGMLDKVFAWTLEYMQDRYAFGRPIGSYQALKHRVADHKVWLEAALGLSSGLTRAYATGDPDVMELACVAKAHIGDQATKIVSDCAQIFGGIAMTWEHDLHLYLRRATVDRALYGSPPQLRERLCVLLGV